MSTICSLGFSLEECYSRAKQGQHGLSNSNIIGGEQYANLFLGAISRDTFKRKFPDTSSQSSYLTFFEQLITTSIRQANEQVGIDLSSDKTAVIITSTKGNIDLITAKHDFDDDRLHLWKSGETIKQHLGLANKPIIVSNACISGIVGLIWGKRFIESGNFEHVVVTGADILSRFVIEGFLSFKALSRKPCKPYDTYREGLNLGEGVATIILSKEKQNIPVRLVRGAVSNDANHISGPSRTGEGLLRAIEKTLLSQKPDYISAHGTATPYNDEMESIAFARSGLLDVPMNSLKGYLGHTLGAAGVIETALAIQSMMSNTVLKSKGFNTLGVSERISPAKTHMKRELKKVLKIGAGFGGCNAALLLEKC